MKLPSTLRSTDLLTDEGAYDAGHVDDWGVNRDMQEEYRCPAAVSGSLSHWPACTSQRQAAAGHPRRLHEGRKPLDKMQAGSKLLGLQCKGTCAPEDRMRIEAAASVTVSHYMTACFMDALWGLRRAPLAKELDACKNAAASLLSYRPHARAELAGKLTDKGFDHETIEAALARLSELVRALSWLLLLLLVAVHACRAGGPGRQIPGMWPLVRLVTVCRVLLPKEAMCACQQGLQSDREFAAVFARSKWRQSRWAPSRIRIVRTHPRLLWRRIACLRGWRTSMTHAAFPAARLGWCMPKSCMQEVALVARTTAV